MRGSDSRVGRPGRGAPCQCMCSEVHLLHARRPRCRAPMHATFCPSPSLRVAYVIACTVSTASTAQPPQFLWYPQCPQMDMAGTVFTFTLTNGFSWMHPCWKGALSMMALICLRRRAEASASTTAAATTAIPSTGTPAAPATTNHDGQHAFRRACSPSSGAMVRNQQLRRPTRSRPPATQSSEEPTAARGSVRPVPPVGHLLQLGEIPQVQQRWAQTRRQHMHGN